MAATASSLISLSPKWLEPPVLFRCFQMLETGRVNSGASSFLNGLLRLAVPASRYILDAGFASDCKRIVAI
jgi:hypothetical protein